MYRTDFVVVGSGSFPFDMLRYDCCFPTHESAAIGGDYELADVDKAKATIEGSGALEGHRIDRRYVMLSRYHHGKDPNIHNGRWASFGWYVQAIVRTVRS